MTWKIKGKPCCLIMPVILGFLLSTSPGGLHFLCTENEPERVMHGARSKRSMSSLRRTWTDPGGLNKPIYRGYSSQCK